MLLRFTHLLEKALHVVARDRIGLEPAEAREASRP